MADHYLLLDRGVEGSDYNDFTVQTSDNTAILFAFRIHDGVTPKKVEVLKALEAMERFFENAQQVGSSGFDVAG
jgi:hypothetical protein